MSTRIMVVLGAAALLATTAVVAEARDKPSEPTPDVIREYAFDYMKRLSQQKLSDREIANQLASTVYWLEKIQLLCPSYFHVNARRVRFSYLLRMGTWYTFFGVGKTATSILNEASAKRNENFNNEVNKKA